MATLEALAVWRTGFVIAELKRKLGCFQTSKTRDINNLVSICDWPTAC